MTQWLPGMTLLGRVRTMTPQDRVGAMTSQTLLSEERKAIGVNSSRVGLRFTMR